MYMTYFLLGISFEVGFLFGGPVPGCPLSVWNSPSENSEDGKAPPLDPGTRKTLNLKNKLKVPLQVTKAVEIQPRPASQRSPTIQLEPGGGWLELQHFSWDTHCLGKPRGPGSPRPTSLALAPCPLPRAHPRAEQLCSHAWLAQT